MISFACGMPVLACGMPVLTCGWFGLDASIGLHSCLKADFNYAHFVAGTLKRQNPIISEIRLSCSSSANGK
jgi:hypothetical protein